MSSAFEKVPGGEPGAIRRIVDVSLKLLDTAGTPVPRDQHPKDHGLVRAEFVVDPSRLPEACRVGLFREANTFPALIRFSNGARKDDTKPDAHGMAIKLFGVDGPKLLDDEEDVPTHDMILVDSPVFFLGDAANYADFLEAGAKGKGKVPSATRALSFFLPGKLRSLAVISLLYYVARGFRGIALFLKFASKKIASPLETRYWSTTPYRLGPDAVVKYSAFPEAAGAGPTDSTSPDYLARAMASALDRGEVRFGFAVQFRSVETSMPVEDPTVEWSEVASPFIRVATIVMPRQASDAPGSRDFCEQLSFTPWRALAEHRPLGGINRARLEVYRALSARRHELNHRPRREPSIREVEPL